MTDTEPRMQTGTAPVRLGLRENLPQFLLLVGINALVGGMIGQERTVLPLLADQTFGLTAYTATLTFIVAFGAVNWPPTLTMMASCLIGGFFGSHLARIVPQPVMRVVVVLVGAALTIGYAWRYWFAH